MIKDIFPIIYPNNQANNMRPHVSIPIVYINVSWGNRILLDNPKAISMWIYFEYWWNILNNNPDTKLYTYPTDLNTDPGKAERNLFL